MGNPGQHIQLLFDIKQYSSIVIVRATAGGAAAGDDAQAQRLAGDPK